MNPNFTATATWLRTVSRIILDGETTPPVSRGEFNSDGTRELLGFQSIVDMHYPVMTNKPRALSYKFMAAEAWWILCGHNSLASIAQYNKVIEKFSDDGQTLFGAYGPRIRLQMEYVLSTLGRDIHSRQAVMSIWRHNPPISKDIPCTIAVQFIVRHGKLYCLDSMRSSDLWLGWPYDVFSFSMVSLMIIILLRERYGIKLKLGELILTAGSQHLYSRNLDAAITCVAAGEVMSDEHPFFSADRFPTSDRLINYLKNCADGKESLTNPA